MKNTIRIRNLRRYFHKIVEYSLLLSFVPFMQDAG
ncbi:MAG: hypothetical protein [Olavius algarvensis Gamma 3 endosymbiont]|nr:MAG: hypothetical protein [Olavius algarvensis Gamma 3 endosymbiont]